MIRDIVTINSTSLSRHVNNVVSYFIEIINFYGISCRCYRVDSGLIGPNDSSDMTCGQSLEQVGRSGVYIGPAEQSCSAYEDAIPSWGLIYLRVCTVHGLSIHVDDK